MPGLASSKWALPTIEDFFSLHVQTLDLPSLDEDNSCCHICQRDFSSLAEGIDPATALSLHYFDELPFAQLKKTDVDEPLRLPCGHALGSSCLQEWFSASGSNQCPFCKRELFAKSSVIAANPDHEYGRRYHEIKNLLLRALLTSSWSEEGSLVFLPADVSSIVARLPRVIFRVAARVQQPRIEGTLVFPGHESKLSLDDGSNFHGFVEGYLGNFEDYVRVLPCAKMLLGDEAKAVFARICNGFRGSAGQELPARVLYAEVLRAVGCMGDVELAKVMVLAVRAMVDYEQRMSDLDSLCGEWY
ncbi:hypothetical protein BU26DRAFT_584136 [Trematosphaeria pertusa]|uniref:RING-type domain-containing protein n=1 Tax=Trematosphaeria pertusa TaxID=390896 RepID=A0A6A6IYB1_9PLEO|nr:uncharacterized protein BU26DRAFT_584136 [Trematosphaeria pertusa]KAF2255394.1 hypothetical protein BU26DRAFT_584136 [Trematosphaeria pertusa]